MPIYMYYYTAPLYIWIVISRGKHTHACVFIVYFSTILHTPTFIATAYIEQNTAIAL